MNEKVPSSANRIANPTEQELKNLDWSDVNPVIDDIQSRRQSVKVEIDAIKSVPGFRYDTGEMGQNQAIKRIQQKEENVALEDEWKRYGGEAIDTAQAEYDANEAKGMNKDLGDRLILQAKLSEAKKRYYLNRLAEQTPMSEENGWDDLANPKHEPPVALPIAEIPEESNSADEETKLVPTPTSETPEEPSEDKGSGDKDEKSTPEEGESAVKVDVKGKDSADKKSFDSQARDEFLKYIANGEKGHFNKGRLKVDGKLQLFLRTKFGKTGAKLADKLTRRTPQEEELAKNYTDSLKAKEAAFLTGFEPGTSEYNARKAEFVTSQHAADALRIAEIQKEDAKKPTNKWLRRAGFVGAGLAGGIIAATPIGWAAGAGAAVALGGAGAIQVHATRRNALTQEKDSENLVVDQLAKKRTSEFNKNVAELQDGDSALGVESLADEHLHGMNSEVEKNRKRMRDPIGAAALAYGATFGTIESIQHLGGSDGGGGEHHPTNNPTESQTEAPDARLTDPVRDGIDEVVDELPDANQGPIDMPTGLETIDTSGYNYPWNWAAEQFGEANAMSELHRLGEIASQNGYEVFWHSLGDGNELNDWISIDGMSDTDSVVNILNQFR